MSQVNYPNDAKVKSAAAVALTSSNQVIGSIAGNSSFVNLTFSLDTSGAYASGDVLADRQPLLQAMREVNKTGILQSLTIIDQDDQKQALDIVFLSADVTLGAENAAASITDANAVEILGIVPVVAGDYNDLGGVSVATKANLGIVVRPALGTQTVFVGLISKGTGVYTAAGIKGRFAFLQD